MAPLTVFDIQKAAPGSMTLAGKNTAASLLTAMDKYGQVAGLNTQRAKVHLLAQVAHESAWFRYDRELWGPTPAQLGYEGAVRLGNTQPGDGFRFRGRGPIQITGRSNYRQFTAWVQANVDRAAPDFEANPDMVTDLNWIGLVPIWYWATRGLTGLLDPFDDLVRVTKSINGGFNGLADRRLCFARLAMVALGYSGIAAADVNEFQRRAGIVVDGSLGPNTRAALHHALDPQPPRVTPATTLRPAPRPSWLGSLLSSIFGKANSA